MAPTLAINYSSGSTDGGVSNTNNQASWIGEGFELASAFIERKYANCYDDRSGGTNSSSTAVDQCWWSDPSKKEVNDEPWDNAVLSMEGHSGELVRVGSTDQWRLEKDDGTRITKIGTISGLNESWRITTPDGTQYYFGKGNASGARPKSVWVVPVFGNHTFKVGSVTRKEPFYSSSFGSAQEKVPWRWNLDYVVSPTGNTITYTYASELSKYKVNNSTSTTYERAGYLTRIEYGTRKGAEVADDSPAMVKFTVAERCDVSIAKDCLTAEPTSSTAKAWVDVPLDYYCQSYCPSQKNYPTYFSRKRLAKIETFTRDAAGTAWEPVDTWTLGGSFPAPTDGGATPSLWLSSITHTGQVGGTSPALTTTLTPMMLDSRITGATVKLEKPRLAIVESETGALTTVEYSQPECNAVTVPTQAQIPDNTKRCMPVWYSPGTAAPTLSWFNKYVVTSVTDRDPVGQSDLSHASLGLDISYDQVTSYTYTGGGGWRYDTSPLTKDKYRTWGQWRGYGKVTAVVGSGATKEVSETTYFRGLNGDKAAASGTATKTVAVTDSNGVTWPDDDWLAGMVRETRMLTSMGGDWDSGSIMDPRVAVLHTDGRLTSRQIDVAKTTNRQRLASGSTRSSIDRTLAWDTYGQPTLAESEGDTAVSGDETCTRSTYATPTDVKVDPVDRVSETTTMPALCATPLAMAQVLSAGRHYYGTTSLTATVTVPALETKLEQYTGSGANRAWSTVVQSVYDSWGRVTSATDTLGNTAISSFTHTAGGLLSRMDTTTPDPDGTGVGTALTTTKTFDTRSGQPVKSVEPGGETTEATLDPLGRVTAVWQPGRSKATQTASTTYAYVISAIAPSTVTTKTLLPDGVNYATSITLLDSMLRTRQTQSDAAISGRIIEDTRYDSRGNPVLVDTYHNSSAPSTALVLPSNRVDILDSHRYTYDFAGRETRDAYYSAETFRWATVNSYEGDRVKVTPAAGGTPSTTVSDIRGRTTQLIEHLGTTTAAPGVTTSYTYDTAGNLATMTDGKGNRWSYTYDLAGNRLAASDPDKGVTTSTYNAANQLTSTTDARGVTLKYFYDNLGRLIRTTKADGTTALVSTTYDTVKKGLVSATTRNLGSGTVTSRIDAYDGAGRPTSATTVVPAITGLIGTQLAGNYTTTTTYNADGSVKTQTLPAAGGLPTETLTVGYTPAGLVKTLTGTLGTTTATYVQDTFYLQWGTVSGLLLGTHSGKAIQTTYNRDPYTQRLVATNLYRQVAPGVTDERAEISYDPAGNIVQVKATEGSGQVDNQCFSYDFQRQLTEAWTPNSATCDVASRSQGSLSGPSPYWTSWATGTTGKTTSRTDRTPTTSSTTTYTYPTDGSSAVRPHFITGMTTSGSTPGSGSYAADCCGEHDVSAGSGGCAADFGVG